MSKTIKTTRQFNDDLINKNIKIKLNEEYKGNLVNHKFMCFCGNIFETQPKFILQKLKPDCGCIQKNKVKEKYKNECLDKYTFTNIEDYIDGTTKILHECKKCKDKILITPRKNKSNKCNNCILIRKKEKYLSDIKELKIELLEDFNEDRSIKLKHRCFCGNEWYSSRESILKGSGCGCKKISHDRLSYLDRKTILYYIKLNNKYKIGIAINERHKTPELELIKRRFSSINDSCSLKIIKYKVFKNGIDAFDTEEIIKNNNRAKKYNGSLFINKYGTHGGETECFNEDIYEDIKEYFETK